MSTLSKFWKIILSYKWGLLIQFAIFIGLAVFFTVTGNVDDGTIEEFERLTGVEIAIFDRDQTELTAGFIAFMSDLHEIVELEDSAEEWQDAVMFAGTSLILEIPVGFTDSFVGGEQDVNLEYLLDGQSTEGFLVREQVERYFNTLSTYLAGGFDVIEATDLTADMLGVGVDIEILEVGDDLFPEAYLYFRFLPVSLVIIVALSTGGVFLALNKQDIIRRIESSPVSYKRRTSERIVSCLTFGIATWVIFVVASFVLFGESMMETENLIRVVNSLPLIFLGIAFAFVISQFVEKREMLFTVTFSIIFTIIIPAGIMFDLSMMGEGILSVARFTPFYWYTRVNDMIIWETAIDWTLVAQGFMIQLAFATAILAVGMVFSKEKRTKRA